VLFQFLYDFTPLTFINKFKNHITEYLRCLFDINRTRYTNLEELTFDIEAHTIKYLKEMEENI
jgi:hypothetical protein